MLLVTRAVILRIQVLAVLCVSMSAFSQTEVRQGEGIRLRLVWERTFDRTISSAAVDKECFSTMNGDISSCLKWILLSREELMLLGGSGSDTDSVLRGAVWGISPSGKHFIRTEFAEDFWNVRDGVHYTVFDWDGNDIWRTDNRWVFPVVLDNGRAVFPDCAISTEPGHREPLWGIKWFDAQGRVIRKHDFLGKHYLWWTQYLAASDSFTAVAAVDSGADLVIFFFGGDGKLLWKLMPLAHGIEEKRRKVSIAVGASPSGGLAVSTCGSVVLALDWWMALSDFVVFVLDREGTIRDSLRLGPTGNLHTVSVFGSLAFVSTERTASDPGFLLCYDLRSFETKFLIKEEGGGGFGSLDVDVVAGLVAVAVYKRKSENLVRIYDLAGASRAQVAAEDKCVGYEKFWSKLLKDALVVGDKNALRLYTIERE